MGQYLELSTANADHIWAALLDIADSGLSTVDRDVLRCALRRGQLLGELAHRGKGLLERRR